MAQDQDPIILPEEMPDAVAEVLGFMPWTTGSIAHAFRAAGHDIKRKCEAEQAFVMWWALKLALRHGPDWHKHAAAELEALEQKAKS